MQFKVNIIGLIFCFVVFSNGLIHSEIIRIIPWWKSTCKEEDFFTQEPAWANSPFAIPLREALHKLGHQFTTIQRDSDLKDSDYVVTFHYPIKENPSFQKKLEKIKREKLLYFVWETPIYVPEAFNKKKLKIFSKVFTWDDELVDDRKYFKLVFPSLRNPMREAHIPFSEKKLCTLISHYRTSTKAGELHSKRIEAVNFFENKHPYDLDVYGHWWPTSFQTYQGPTENKFETLSRYKFYICYENSAFPGNITEKIFDCFHAGCLPIYLGAPDIAKYVPENCFIDRRNFSSNEELYQFLLNFDEEQYNIYCENIQRFMDSEQGYVFSIDYFIHTFISSIFPNYNRDLIFTKQQQKKIQKAKDILQEISCRTKN